MKQLTRFLHLCFLMGWYCLGYTQSNGNHSNFLADFYEEGTTALSNANPGFSTARSSVQILFLTVAFIAVIAVIIRFTARKAGVMPLQDEGFVEVLLTSRIGLGHYLQIVKIGTLYYLLSVSADSVRKIDLIEDKETLDALELHHQQTMRQPSQEFSQILSAVPGGKNLLGFMQSQKDKLRQMGPKDEHKEP